MLKRYLCVLILLSIPMWGRDWYVSINRGKGKVGTIEQPAKDLGNIIALLQPGDVVHIAEGVYLGRGENGSDVVKVPISIIGGYADDFSARDPWGAHSTILSGNNASPNWVSTPRIFIDLNLYRQNEMPPIRVDGLIIDHAGRNHYSDESRRKIVRKANPKTGSNPTPDMGALVIGASKTNNPSGTWQITVENCIIMNAAPTQGALTVSGHKGSQILIRNNAILNNTGVGIFLGSKYVPSDKSDVPAFTLENNTILFTWKYDPVAQSFSGNALEVDGATTATLRHNVLAFSDRFGINNAKQAKILLENNLITGNVEADYLEFNTRIGLDDIEDEANVLDPASSGNISKSFKVPVSPAWAKDYADRVLVDRNAMEADIKAQESRVNDLRSMLGLPLQAGTVDGPESPVWLNCLSVEDALKAVGPHEGFGAKKP
ncbi:MAG: right-handed parallel beta-helix repeat-containing protein [Acidobacteria bacterium]|nr:right-handed parallel beta-helix repeat-containing protein [Acidobacteriota bacterium]